MKFPSWTYTSVGNAQKFSLSSQWEKFGHWHEISSPLGHQLSLTSSAQISQPDPHWFHVKEADCFLPTSNLWAWICLWRPPLWRLLWQIFAESVQLNPSAFRTIMVEKACQTETESKIVWCLWLPPGRIHTEHSQCARRTTPEVKEIGNHHKEIFSLPN